MAVGGPVSRIPVAIPRKQPLHQRTVSAPSKLEKLRFNYQEKLYQQKEERLVQILNREQNQPFSPAGNSRTNQTPGKVRDFFRSRRDTNDYDTGRPGPGYLVNQPGNKTYGAWTAKPPVYKNSQGRDRANPLAPIEGPPSLPGSGRLQHRTASAGSIRLGSAKHTPTPPPFEKKPRLTRNNRRFLGTTSNANANLENQPALRPVRTIPNRPALLKRPKLSAAANHSEGHGRTTSEVSPSKKSDFAKWQMEQDKAREERLKKHRVETNKINRLDLDNGTFEDDINNNQFSYRSDKLDAQITPSKPPWQKKLDNNNHIKQQKKMVLSARNQQISYDDSDEEDAATLGRSFAPSNLSSVRSARGPESSRSPSHSRAGKSGRETAIEEELRKKEQQLLALINQQKTELAQLQAEKDKDEEEEQREEEQRKKREMAQKERQHKLRAAEHRVRKMSQPSPLPSSRSQMSQHSPAPPKQSPKPQQKPVRRRTNIKQNPLPPREPSPEEYVRDLSTAAQYLEMAENMGSEAIAQVDLAGCPNCGRKFAQDRLPKHAKVCKDATKKAAKRKVFDPVKMRVQGTEAEKFTNNPQEQPKKKPKKNNWKAKHEEFVKSIRYARKVTEVEKHGGNLADLPPPPVSENPDYVQCPHCQRKFNPNTAERHIPKCKETKARPAPPKYKRR